MARSPLRRISALATFFAFLALAASGLVMLALPGGGGQRGYGQFATVLGISRHDWREFHEVAAIVFLIAVSVHLACNWRAMARHLGLGSAAARLSSRGGRLR